MSAWSSTTGKTTYAERLRLASQSSGTPTNGRTNTPPSSTKSNTQSHSVGSTSAAIDTAKKPYPAVVSPSSNDTSNATVPESSNASQSKVNPTASLSSSLPKKTPTNVWEARKQQLNDKETVKPKGSSPGPNGNVSPPHARANIKTDPSAARRSAQYGTTDRPSQNSVTGESLASDGMSLASSKQTGETERAHPASAAVRDSRQSSHISAGPANASVRHSDTKTNADSMPLHSSASLTRSDDKVSNAGSVASAIEATMKKGSESSTEADDSNAWLARIHMLNGGQNMPHSGEYGPNSASNLAGGSNLGSLSSEEDVQAAKKAERAVAAAWGAGKSVWQKSQQQQQQQQQQEEKPSPSLTTSPPIPQHVRPGECSVAKDSPTTAQPTINERGMHTPSQDSAKTVASEKATSKKTITKQGRKDQQPAPPSFGDVSKWPSPLDAVKNPTGKGVTSNVVSPKATNIGSSPPSSPSPPQTEKSIYETLSELHLQVAPGAAPHSAVGNSANGRKGKQWISIVPNITHTSSNQKQHTRSGDGKPSRGPNKQVRKEKSSQNKAGSPHRAQKEEARGESETGQPPSATQLVPPPAITGSSDVFTNKSGASPSSLPSHTSPSPRQGGSPTKQGPFQSRNSHSNVSVSSPSLASGTVNGTPTVAQSHSGTHGPVSYSNVPPFVPRLPTGSKPNEMAFSPSLYSNGAQASPAGRGAGWMPFVPYVRPSPPPTQMIEATSQTGAPLPSGAPGQLLSQIEFYFSQRNLEGDFFLRQKMDAEGWVDVSFVAAFKRVQGITRDLHMIEDALLHSAVLDLDAERKRVRRRYGWEMYVLPDAVNAVASVQQSHGSTDASATPTASRGSTGLVSPPSSFSRSSEGGSAENGQGDDESEDQSKEDAGVDDDQILGIVASSGLGGTLDKHSSIQ